MERHLFASLGLLGLLFCFTASDAFSSPRVKLLSGYEMPVLGLGTYALDNRTAVPAVRAALSTGYRLIDTATAYENEEYIGRALSGWFNGGGERQDLFVTTKLPIQGNRREDVSTFVQLSLDKLGLEYLDLYVIHMPVGTFRTKDYKIAFHQDGLARLDTKTDLVAVWREMERQVRRGKIRSIGLSNVNATQLLRIWNYAEIKPSVLQIENNAYIQEDELRGLARKLGVVVASYSPLGSPYTDIPMRRKRDASGFPRLLDDRVLNRIARKHRKSSAQVSLRFNLQRHLVALPKSAHPARIRENFDVFDFSLDEDDMRSLKSLDRRGTYRKYTWTSALTKGAEKHPEYPWPNEIY